MSWLWSFWLRHRASILDLGFLAALLGLLGYVALSIDIFVTEPGESETALTLELDEMLLLGSVLMTGLLIFAVRRYVAQRRETRRRMRAEYRARELAYQDPLTGLANRRKFGEALDVAIRSPAGSESVHALFLLDLNGFKQINDVHGHGVGDEVLILVAQRLLEAVRPTDLVGRFGGDEFAILAQHLMGPEAAAAVAQRIIDALDAPMVTGSAQHRIGVGIGIVPLGTDTATEALRKADVALYRAKSERRSAWRFFSTDMDELVRQRHLLEGQLRDAIAGGLIRTVFQPAVELLSGEVIGFEAVPRWTDPQGGEIEAARFLPLAEEIGLVHALAEQTLRDACHAALGWPAGIRLSVNLYRGQLTDAALAPRLLGVLRELRFEPARLDVEIAESVLVENLPGLRDTFETLRAAGVRIALDHFGTGYSTLYHLREFRIDRVKIDRSFVADDAESRRLLNALAGLGRGLGMEVVAEGLDTLGDGRDILKSGIQQAQGAAFGTALTAAQTLGLVALKDPAHRQAS